jgi:hypothetical protein
LSTLYSFIKRKNAYVRIFKQKNESICFSFNRDIIMDDRDLNFSKSDDEQSEMSNHDYEQDIKPVILIEKIPKPSAAVTCAQSSKSSLRKPFFDVNSVFISSGYY